jgi:hypothetical protein
MHKLTLAAAVTAAVAATIGAAAPAEAFFGSNINGPQLTGIALPSAEVEQATITAVTLPSGETVDLREHPDK